MLDAPQPADLHLVSGGLDRAANRRADDDWLREQWQDPTAQLIWVSHGSVAVQPAQSNRSGSDRPGSALLTGVPTQDCGPWDAPQVGERVTFLGIDDQRRPAFVVHHPEPSLPGPWGDAQWKTLRELGLRLPAQQASMAVTAIALDNWRRRTRRCPGCGDALVAKDAGWALTCPTESTDHFPRTDPAVIVLVRDQRDRALLGRHVNWEAGWMSTIAGFVEAGESAEAATRREVAEETGVRIGTTPDHLAYLGSQPWPFPASLMLGYHAWVDRQDATASEIAVDQTEIAEASWFSRTELEGACQSGEVRLPPRLSISRYLIEQWFGAPLPGDWLRG